MKRAVQVAGLYTFFAVISIAVNLGVQAISVWLYRGAYGVAVSILVGTAVALPLKYVLDKRHIFEFKPEGLAHDSRLFFVYSITGVFTTLQFWAIEYSFYWLFETDLMRYFGGAVGLIIGFLIKYRLDRRFVFCSEFTTLKK